MAEPLAERLRAWREAGLIDDAAVAAIEAYEAARIATPPPAVAETISGAERLTVAEALAYTGFAVVLAGILYAVFSSLGGAAAGPVSLVLAACPAGLAAVFDRESGPSSRRAAGAAMAVAIGLAGLGVGTVLVNAGVYTTTYMLPTPQYGGYNLTVVQHNDAALAAIAAAVAVVFGSASLRWVATPLLALVVAAAAEVTAFTATQAAGGAALQRWGVAPLAVGACLLVLASAPRLAAAADVLRFVALVVAPPALLAVGGINDAPTWPLIVLAAAIATGSMAASVQVGRASLAAAGGIGVLSVAIDVTQRTLGSNGNASVVLIVSGLLLVGCAALTERAMRRARQQRAALA